MIKFDYITDESEHRFLQRLSSYSAMASIPFDDCNIVINADDNKVRASVICSEFKMYKINDTDYCYFNSLFSKTNFTAKVFCDKNGKTHLKGITLPCLPQLLFFLIPIILGVIMIVLPSFSVNFVIDSFFIAEAFFFLSVIFLVQSIIHAALSCARLKKFLKSGVEADI